MAFSSDGAKMFVIGLGGDDVNEYALSTAFDVSTATFVSPPFDVSSQETNPTGMAFSSDGAKMFVIGYDGDNVNEYALSTAFDVSTAEFAGAFSVSSRSTLPAGMAFSSDGAKMFVVDSGSDRVSEYALSTAFDASTAKFAGAFSVSSRETNPTGMAFSSDGAKMFVVGFAGEDINEYTLSSVYPITVTGMSPMQDTTPPTIELVGDNPIEASHGSTYADQGATCTDDTDGTIVPVLASNDVDTGSIGTYSVVYSCTDDAGNESTVTRTVRVVDDTPPVITLTGDAAVTITVGEAYDEQGAVCDDGVDPDKAATVGGDTVDTGTPGVYVITYDCRDASDNDAVQVSRTVNVEAAPDTTPPVITLTGPAAVTITVGASYADEGATCTDDTDTNPTLSTDNPVDTATAATYTVTYSCEDDAGNHATEVTRAVIVQEAADTTPPTFVSSELDIDAGVLTITFSETIDAANIVPAKMHIRESGNYTHGTTLTAGELDTDADGATVSFALTPSHRAAVAGLAAPELTIEPGAVRDESGNLIVGTFDASTRTFVDATSIQAQETQPRDIAFSNDGTKMFIVGDVKDNVNEYTLSTPFDASTLTFVDATSIRAQDHQPRGMAFSNDGTKMFVVGYLGDNVNEYTLSTPFDASTLTFVDATSIQAQEDDARSVAFSNDGTKMFVMGVVGDDVNEYALSTPFDASTLTFIDATPISSEEAFPTGMVFSNDGTKMFVIGWEEYVNEYALSTPFDASTLMFTDATSISSEESDSQGIAFSNDGAKMFIIGVVGDDVNEYELSSVYPVTVTRMPPTFVASELDIDAGVLTITFSETIDAANIVPAKIHVRETGNYTHGVTLTAGELGTGADGATVSFALTPSHLAAVAGLAAPELTIEPGAVRDESGNLIVGTFDASTRTFVDATSIRDHETQPRGMAFSNDGAKMFVIGGIIDSVKEYALSTPFDASTLTLTDATDISSQDGQPRGMAFSNYGTKMFVIDSGTDDVNEYALSTPFDASTLAFIDAADISSWETDPTGIAFSNDGTKMFILGGDGDDVNEYDLSSPFDASTRSFVDATGIGGQDTSPRGIAFSNDGTKMFMLGGDGDDVNEYDLSAPFDASTRRFIDATSISEQETDPQGIAFSSDGAKMFVIGDAGDGVNEYDLHSVYPITVTRTPPTFVSSVLDFDAGVLTITFSETIDAANVVPARMHVRETGNYTHGVTLSAGELDTVSRRRHGIVCPHSITPCGTRRTGHAGTDN